MKTPIDDQAIEQVDWAVLGSQVDQSYREQSRELFDCTIKYADALSRVKRAGRGDLLPLWNAACHTHLVWQDLLAYAYFLTKTDEAWPQRTVARSVAILVHEAVDDLQTIFGKSFLVACRAANVPTDLVTAYKTAKKQLSDFGKQHASLVKSIRMGSGAHRDHDIDIFIKTVAQACPGKILDVSKEFRNILNEMAIACDQILLFVTESVGFKEE